MGTQNKRKKTTRSKTRKMSTEWWDKEAKKGVGMKMCERCEAVYYEGCWHTAPELPAVLKEKKLTSKMLGFCTECKWVMEGGAGVGSGFEGEVTLDGIRDKEEKKEILRTVRNFSRKASERDPEDQIIGIDDRGERIVITTSENQMAVGIGKAVDQAFKGGKLSIIWSDDDLPVRVYWKHKNT